MKKFILKLALLALSAGTLMSCDEDTVTYGGENFVSFDKVSSIRFNTFENAGVSNIPVYLAFPKSYDVKVNFTVTSTVAVAGVDYNVVTPGGSLTIPAGQTSANIQIDVINNEIMNDSKTLTVTLTGVDDSGIALGIDDVASSVKNLLIINDDCTTNFIVFIGKYNVLNGDGDNIGTAEVDVTETGECNIINISGVIEDILENPTDGFIQFTMTPGAGSNKNVGTLTAVQQLYCEECYNDGDVNQTVLFSGGGTFNYNPASTNPETIKRLSISGSLFFASATGAIASTSVRLVPVVPAQ